MLPRACASAATSAVGLNAARERCCVSLVGDGLATGVLVCAGAERRSSSAWNAATSPSTFEALTSPPTNTASATATPSTPPSALPPSGCVTGASACCAGGAAPSAACPSGGATRRRTLSVRRPGGGPGRTSLSTAVGSRCTSTSVMAAAVSPVSASLAPSPCPGQRRRVHAGHWGTEREKG